MINLNNWAVTLPTADTVYPIEFNEFIKTDGVSLSLITPCTGEPTENSSYPRCELREIINGKKARWSSRIGKHLFEIIISVDHLPKMKPVISVFQIHDGKNDLLQVLVDGNEIKYNYNGIKFKVLNYNLGERFRIKCKVKKNMVRLQLNFEDEIKLAMDSDSLFFKAGNYLQSNFEIENDKTQSSKISIWDLKADHLF